MPTIVGCSSKVTPRTTDYLRDHAVQLKHNPNTLSQAKPAAPVRSLYHLRLGSDAYAAGSRYLPNGRASIDPWFVELRQEYPRTYNKSARCQDLDRNPQDA